MHALHERRRWRRRRPKLPGVRLCGVSFWPIAAHGVDYRNYSSVWQSTEIQVDGTGSCTPLFHRGACNSAVVQVPSPLHQLKVITQIVASAVNVLFARFRMWTRLQDLHLSNIAFPKDTNELFPALPTLRKLYLGQATLVPVVPLACLLCDPRMESLILVRLVDCYVESIWGPRLRRADLERGALQAHYGKTWVGEDERIGGHYGTILDRIRTVVRCEALTERIIGGDRVERLGILE